MEPVLHPSALSLSRALILQVMGICLSQLFLNAEASTRAFPFYSFSTVTCREKKNQPKSYPANGFRKLLTGLVPTSPKKQNGCTWVFAPASREVSYVTLATAVSFAQALSKQPGNY